MDILWMAGITGLYNLSRDRQYSAILSIKGDMGMSYKLEQAKTKEALKPKVIDVAPRVTRKLMRQRIVNRKFTKKNYAFGLKIGGRDYNLIQSIAKRQK